MITEQTKNDMDYNKMVYHFTWNSNLDWKLLVITIKLNSIEWEGNNFKGKIKD